MFASSGSSLVGSATLTVFLLSVVGTSVMTLVACGTDPKPTAVIDGSASAAVSGAGAPSAPPAGAVLLDTSKSSGPGVAPAPSPEPTAAPPVGARPKSMPTTNNGLIKKAVADGILKTGEPPKLSMLSPGREPRDKLAYDYEVGRTTQLSMGMKMRLKMSAGDRAMPAPEIPKVNMLMALTTKSKSPAGDFEIDAGINEASVTPTGPLEQQIAVKMQPQLEAIKGVRIHYFVSPTGRVRDVDVAAAAGGAAGAEQTLGQLTQSFESMVAPMPEEAVGVGAKWEVVSRVASSGADLLQWATYELTAREGSAISVGLTVHQLAADSAITAPGMPPGMSATLRRFQSEGRGQSKLDLTSAAPVSGQVAVQSVMEIGVDAGGAPQPPGAADSMTVDSHVTVDFSRPAPSAK